MMGRELRRGSQRGGRPADSRRRVGFVSSSRPGRPGRESSSTRRRIPLTTTKKRGAMTRLLRPMHALLLQTDCKRPACNEPSDGVTRRHMASREDARRGLVWPSPALAVTPLGKLITQRSQVQILSPRRGEAAGQRPAASFMRARRWPDPGQTANGLQTEQDKPDERSVATSPSFSSVKPAVNEEWRRTHQTFSKAQPIE
jgi:hypothetical protein